MSELAETDDVWESHDKWLLTQSWWYRNITLRYYNLVPYDYRPFQLLYRFRCWAWYRYTTVHPRTLPWHTWMDRDTLFEHCAFEILCQFVEKEKPAEHWDLENSPNKDLWPKLFECYRWWKDVYETAWKRHESVSKYDADLTKWLHVLVECRMLMWT